MFDDLAKAIGSEVIRLRVNQLLKQGFSAKDSVVRITKEALASKESISSVKLYAYVRFVVESATLSADDFNSSFAELDAFYQSVNKLID